MSVIYFVEANPKYVSLVRPIFRHIADGQLSGVASTITLMEVLAKPLGLGEAARADQLEAPVFTHGE